MAEGRWLSGKKEIASYLGVSGRTLIRMWGKYSDFPMQLVERRFTSHTDDLDAWIKRRDHVCATCGQVVTK